MGVCVCGMCEGCVPVCVCVCVYTDKSPKATTFWFPAVPVFSALPLFLSLIFLVVSVPRGSSPTPSGLAVTLGKVRWA